jgi:hypothetical protein
MIARWLLGENSAHESNDRRQVLEVFAGKIFIACAVSCAMLGRDSSLELSFAECALSSRDEIVLEDAMKSSI